MLHQNQRQNLRDDEKLSQHVKFANCVRSRQPSPWPSQTRSMLRRRRYEMTGPLLLALQRVGHPFGQGSPRQHRIDGHAVMDHVDRDVEHRFIAEENLRPPPPVPATSRRG